MSDLIGRNAVENALHETWKKHPYKQFGFANTYLLYNEAWSDAIDYATTLISKIPSEPQWIPVSERLPDFGVDVLVCNDEGVQVTAKRTGWSTDPNYWAINYCGYDYDSWDFATNGDIVAWMPMPKPYERKQG